MEFVASIVVSWGTLSEIVEYKIRINPRNLDRIKNRKGSQRLRNHYGPIRIPVVHDKVQPTNKKEIT